MKKSVLLLLVSTFVVTSACTTSNPFGNNSETLKASRSVDGTVVENPIPINFAQFADIPVPENAQMDLAKTFVFGAKNQWVGRLVMDVPYSHGSLFDFYLSEMPKFGWKEVTVVRAKSSVMTFSQKDRVATIQLDGDDSDTQVFFTVSPAIDGTNKSKTKFTSY